MEQITKITKYNNVIMQHKTDKKRTFMKKELLKIEFEGQSPLLLIIKPKSEQNCFNGETFDLKKSFTTREKIIFKI